jgi:sulfotransferase
MNDKLFFVSGLPRSGSTLLMNLLGQHPNHYVTPTSGLIELFIKVKNGWKNQIEFKAEGLDKIKPRIESAMNGVLHGYFEKELSEGKVIFDKSRGWLQYIEDLETALKRKVYIIVPIRDIRDILASFEKIYRKRGVGYEYWGGSEFFIGQTTVGRCQNLLLSSSVLGLAINRIRDAIDRGVQDRLIFVPYMSFTKEPFLTVNAIHKMLGLDPFNYNTENVEQVTYENDLYHGMDLHTIRNEILPGQTNTWQGILPDRFAEGIAKDFQDITNLMEPQIMNTLV